MKNEGGYDNITIIDSHGYQETHDKEHKEVY